MRNGESSWTRRRFGMAATSVLAGAFAQARKKTVAAIITQYDPDSHAHVIITRMLEGYAPDGVPTQPRTRIVSMYTDQVPADDISRIKAAQHQVKIYSTPEEALTLGGNKLAVDAVLLICEQGTYPENEKGQKLYPRYEFFEKTMDVFQRSGRSVPVFLDKHFSYSWTKAKKMYAQARELGFPFMAGSSTPLAIRVPPLELPLGCEIEHAVSVNNTSGEVEAYGFHALELLQCMVERRAGAETGIAAVHALQGDAVWKWRDSAEGRWSAPLLNAALSRARSQYLKPGKPEDGAKWPVLFLLEYRSGLRAASYLLEGYVRENLFAAKLRNRAEPLSTNAAWGQNRRASHFDGLVHCIEEMFVTGRPMYPVERTLLTTGALAFLMDSLYENKRLPTPELNVAYQAPAQAYFQRA